MTLQPGDQVTTKPRSTEVMGQSGVVEEVLAGDPRPRYRIRWADGHQSIYSPEAGTLSAQPKKPKRRGKSR